MNAPIAVWLVVCIAGLVLSLKSAAVLRGRSRWTIAGWLATAAYFVLSAVAATAAKHPAAHADYVALAVLTLCFVIAGTRDEPQAEPWYWPTAPGPTGAERKAARR
jgi:hypothetical protein